jgi:hypothetical protein
MKKHSWLNPIFLSFCFILGLSSAALADQCSYITKEQSLAATARLQVGQTIYQFCEPCGDKKPTPISIKDLSASTTGFQDYWEVKVNNANIDLAYTFIDAGIANQKINLASIIGCPARNVSVVLPGRGDGEMRKVRKVR